MKGALKEAIPFDKTRYQVVERFGYTWEVIPNCDFMARVIADHLRRFKHLWYMLPEHIGWVERHEWWDGQRVTERGKHWLEKYGFLADGTVAT